MRLPILVTAVVLSGLAALPGLSTAPAGAGPAPTSFTFGAAGDMGGGSDASATLNTLAGAGTDF